MLGDLRITLMGQNCIVAANCKLRGMSFDDNFHDLLKRELFSSLREI